MINQVTAVSCSAPFRYACIIVISVTVISVTLFCVTEIIIW